MGKFAENFNLGNRFRPPLFRKFVLFILPVSVEDESQFVWEIWVKLKNVSIRGKQSF